MGITSKRGNHQQNYSQDASFHQELYLKSSENNDILLGDIKLEDSDNLNSVEQNDETFNAEKIKKNVQNLMEFTRTKYGLKFARME